MSHHCPVVVVTCMDFRFVQNNNDFIQTLGLRQRYDLVSAAGAALNLARPKAASDRGFILRQIQTAVRLHEAEKVILIDHQDCGAYPPFKDVKAEYQAHVMNLKQAKELLLEKYPKVTVELYYMHLPKAEGGEPRYEKIK